MQPPESTAIRDRSLEELEPDAGPVSEGESYLSSEMRRLRQVPLKQLRLEDMRLLIGQSVGLQVLIPVALDHVESHPLAAGDFYPGDLLKNVMEVSESFWNGRPELRSRLVVALERALERIRNTRTVRELEGEFRAGLERHRAAFRKAV